MVSWSTSRLLKMAVTGLATAVLAFSALSHARGNPAQPKRYRIALDTVLDRCPALKLPPGTINSNVTFHGLTWCVC